MKTLLAALGVLTLASTAGILSLLVWHPLHERLTRRSGHVCALCDDPVRPGRLVCPPCRPRIRMRPRPSKRRILSTEKVVDAWHQGYRDEMGLVLRALDLEGREAEVDE